MVPLAKLPVSTMCPVSTINGWRPWIALASCSSLVTATEGGEGGEGGGRGAGGLGAGLGGEGGAGGGAGGGDLQKRRGTPGASWQEQVGVEAARLAVNGTSAAAAAAAARCPQHSLWGWHRGRRRRRRRRIKRLGRAHGLDAHAGVGRADVQVRQGAVAKVDVGAPAVLRAGGGSQEAVHFKMASQPTRRPLRGHQSHLPLPRSVRTWTTGYTGCRSHPWRWRRRPGLHPHSSCMAA